MTDYQTIPSGTDILSVLDELSPPGPDGTQDIGGACYRFTDVKHVFRVAYYFLSVPSVDQQGKPLETGVSCKPYASFLSRVIQEKNMQRLE